MLRPPVSMGFCRVDFARSAAVRRRFGHAGTRSCGAYRDTATELPPQSRPCCCPDTHRSSRMPSRCASCDARVGIFGADVPGTEPLPADRLRGEMPAPLADDPGSTTRGITWRVRHAHRPRRMARALLRYLGGAHGVVSSGFVTGGGWPHHAHAASPVGAQPSTG